MRWIQLFLVAAFVLGAWSLTVFATVHPYLWPVLGILALNVAGTILSFITGISTRRVTWRGHQHLIAEWSPAGGTYPSVDVFLPTCGESLTILDNTYRHIAALQWSGQMTMYVLDDSVRPAVAALAKRYGYRYVVRLDRGHLRKAGNLRHAFVISAGDLIAIFDADFCPRPDFFTHLVPYLDDPSVAIVQSPQCFDTTEAMTWIQRTAGATQEFFYRWVLPSRDRLDAANCVGTSAIYRRSALAKVGGFAPIEHSEDLHTGRNLVRAGFRIRYVPLLLSRGLCPSDLAGFLNQQYRWCQGTLSKLATPESTSMDDLATVHRPRLRQRLAQWAGVVYYISTAVNVFLLFLPGIVMAAVYPDDVRPVQLVPFLLALWVYLVLFPMVSITRWRFEVLRIQIAYSFSHAVAIWHKVIGRKTGWVPTGVVGSSNRLARTISGLGAATTGSSLIVFWVFVARGVVLYGLAQFWMMVGFVLAYTYLVVPLLSAFRTVLRPSGADPEVGNNMVIESASTARAALQDARTEVTRRRPKGPNWNRISGWEVVGHTSAILFIGALALGWFDIMLPWTTA